MMNAARIRKSATAIVAAVAVLFSGHLTVPAYADTADINITNVTVRNETLKETDPNATLRQWDKATFAADWDAPNGVKAGDTFTVKYPDGFKLFAAQDFNLEGKNGEVGGKCKVVPAETQIECTFNEAFVGRDDVRGTLYSTLQATEARKSREVELSINGNRTISAELPGNGDGVTPDDNGVPGDFEKWGWYDDDGKHAVWVINLPGELLVGKDRLTVEDSFTSESYPHKFTNCDGQCEVYLDSYKAIKDGDNIKIGDHVGYIGTGIQNIQRTDNSLKFDIVEPYGGWDENLYYRVYYRTITADGNFAPQGKKTTNNARINGNETTATIERTEISGGTIQGVDRQSFAVKKVLADSMDKSIIPQNTKFTIQAKYNDGSAEKTEKIQVGLDGNLVAGGVKLRKGTKVTLTEVDLPEIEGVTFGDPEFAPLKENDPNVEISADKKSAVITIINEDNVGVKVTNIAQKDSSGGGIGNGSSGSSDNKNLWWLLLLVPLIGGLVALLANQFPNLGKLLPPLGEQPKGPNNPQGPTKDSNNPTPPLGEQPAPPSKDLGPKKK
ncbi:MAG: Ig-like domain-containing protein [Corynebacterium sp.]|uniref:Ig-like domain-containing protein n=1 Tax=Corynebacterium sp. TaxID=1720 RepID=UPI0026DAF40B|nr:Ig-like domain-containing protein [Corynebacterium sp.]MDO5099416.1 Ig-like domain-containing protein [Corynebacterium sp.]